MLRDVTITKVRALVFDVVNFGMIEGDVHQLSKAYNLDLYHILNMRDLGWIVYDAKTNTIRSQIGGRVNVEELTSILITKYVERKKARKEKSNYYTPTLKPWLETPKPKAKQATAPTAPNLLTRLKLALNVLFNRK
jgi:hypothetical protein